MYVLASDALGSTIPSIVSRSNLRLGLVMKARREMSGPLFAGKSSFRKTLKVAMSGLGLGALILAY